MIFPPELYEQILFHLPLPDLVRLSRVSRLFREIARWHVIQDDYISKWRLSLQENGGQRRLISLDKEETRKHLAKKGLYIFNVRIQPVSWTNRVVHVDVSHLNMQVLDFGLRFLDNGDLTISEYAEGIHSMLYALIMKSQ